MKEEESVRKGESSTSTSEGKRGMKGELEATSLWPLAAAKCKGELRPPKVEYLARQGLQSRSIFASSKSPSRAADTNRSPEAEQPNELPIVPSLPPFKFSGSSAWNGGANYSCGGNHSGWWTPIRFQEQIKRGEIAEIESVGLAICER